MLKVLLPIKVVSVANLRDEARRVFSYDSETGVFIRTVKSGRNVVVGAEAGGVDPQGYRRLCLFGRLYGAHRVAWLYVHGVWPKGKIDHINGIRNDNRMANLRDVDHSTNLENQRAARCDNRIGVLGVRSRRAGSFEARIWVKGKPRTIGVFKTLEEASAAYLAAKRELHQGCTL